MVCARGCTFAREAQSINGLKVDNVEGIANVVLPPRSGMRRRNFGLAFLIIGDTNKMWQVVLLSESSPLGYSVAARMKLNALSRR
jgi:hypothetical protein